MDNKFSEVLKFHFIRAMGPLAEIVIEDEIRNMGEVPEHFPRCRTADLVRFLSRQIPRSESRIAFLKVMAREIKNRSTEGYR